VAVEIIDDGDCEMAERFYLSLDSSEPLVSFPVNNVEVVIDGTTEYDDCASVRAGFLFTRYDVREGDGVVRVCVGAFEPQKFGARFHLIARTRDGTARGGSDFIPLEDLTVGPLDRGQRVQCFLARLINDNVCGNDPGRFFTIELSSHDSHVDVNPRSTRVYINDATECIPVRIGFVVTTAHVREDEVVAVACARVLDPPLLEREVTVTFSTAPGTAVDTGDIPDFTAVNSREIVFSPDAQTVCINTTVMNDAACEGMEYFSFSLSSSAPTVQVAPSTSYIIISDPPFCNSVEVGLEQQTYTTYEGAGSVEVCVRVAEGDLPLAEPFNLLVSTQDGSAQAPSDYLPLTDAVIGPFDSGTPEQCFSVAVVQDTVCEGRLDEEGFPRPEVFSAVVRREEGSSVEVKGAGQVASISIEDSPECIPVEVGLGADSYTVRESEGGLELTVNVTSPAVLRRNVRLRVETAPGTATPDADYNSGSLTLPPFSQDRRSLTITLLVTDLPGRAEEERPTEGGDSPRDRHA
jgi:hypothetical protein